LTRRVLAATVVLAAHGGIASAAWSPPATVPGSHGFGHPFDVAVRPDGPVAVAFVSGRSVRIAVRRARGGWDAVARRPSGGRAATTPDLAFDGRGRLVAVWVEELRRGRGPHLVRSATRSRAGRWSHAQTVGVAGHFRGAAPRVAANHRGDAVIVWRGVGHGRTRSGTEVVRAVHRPAGRDLFGRTARLEGREGEIVASQQVAIGDDGRAYAVWANVTRRVNRMAVRRRGRWGRPFTVSPAPSSLPAVAVARGRDVVVAWHRAATDSEGDGTQLGGLAARWLRPGGRLTPAQDVSAARIHRPGLAVSPAGETMLAYGEEGGPLRTAVAPPGGPFGPEQVADAIPAGPRPDAPAQRLGYVADGTAVLAYGGDGVHAAERPAGGLFGEPVPLSAGGDFPILATAANVAAAVWAEGFVTDGEQRLVLSRRAP
jgi:hypothetical protein